MEQTQSDSIDELAKAMVKVQLGLPGAKKSNKNDFYKSNYADIKDCIEAGREILSENGLVVIQTFGGSADTPSVITTLMHTSGQWIKGEGFMTPDKKGPQGTGSALTYGRRYGYSAIIGLHQEDDDAEGATDRKKAAQNKQTPKDKSKAGVDDLPLNPSLISEAQRKRMFAIGKKNNWPDADIKILIGKHGFESSKDITKTKYEKIVEQLEKVFTEF